MTYTVPQLCERWQCDARTVLSAIHSGRLRAFPLTIGAKRPTWRVPGDAVAAYESGQSVEATPAKSRRRKQTPDVIEFFK